MRLFNKLYGISLFTLLLTVASCTSETEEQLQKPAPEPSGGETRREVMLTLKNKLSIAQTKAGDEIATAAENKISALDIYVFGSATEDGTYTYQERFCYRENSADLPMGVTAFDLTAVGSDGKQTTALLSLQKGLFVKLYCIANQSELIDPVTSAAFNSFLPLQQSAPGQPGNTVIEGTPTEAAFKLFQSTPLTPASATDILQTPLPMAGAYDTPLDLTDFSVSARLQLGFRLTRSVARFDIVNDAKTSKFTIQSVSMSNGRKGVSFFPLKVVGTLPDAGTGDLITYPARPFDGTDANAGTTVSAFYSYPSPKEDGGYLILSGTYAVNQTENIAVTYKVPFKPAGDGNYIEVTHNHRYTVNITAADEYHLDFTLDVADWTDEGTIDEYKPGGETDKDGMTITINGKDGTYDPDTRTVTMTITNDAQFTIEGNSTSGYFTRMYYENDDADHQWLTMDPEADYKPTKTDVIQKTYTIKKNSEYKDTKFPVAFIRFTDKISAKETIVIVQPIANPVVLKKTISDGSTIDIDRGEIILYKSSVVPSPTVTFSVFSSGGSKLEFPDGDTPGTWLTITPGVEQDQSQADYTLAFNSSADDFPDPFPVGGKTINVINKGDESKKTTLTLKLKSDITVTSVIEGKAIFDNPNSVLYLYNTGSDKIKLTANTIGGSELVDVPGWVTVTKENENKNQTTYTFAPKGTGANAKFSIRSKADNTILKTYTVYSISPDITYSSLTTPSSYTTSTDIATSGNNSPVITFFPCSNSTTTFTITSPQGVKVSNPGTWATTSTEEALLLTGQQKTTVTLSRSQDDAYFSSIRGNLSFTMQDKYSGNTRTVTLKQYPDGIVYPGSNTPAKSIASAKNDIRWWVAPVNANNGKVMNFKTFESQKNSVCPSGWKVPSSANYRTLLGWEKPSDCLVPNETIAPAVLSKLYELYSKDSKPYYSSDSQLGEYRNGFIPYYYHASGQYCVYINGLGASELYIRCVKDK